VQGTGATVVGYLTGFLDLPSLASSGAATWARADCHTNFRTAIYIYEQVHYKLQQDCSSKATMTFLDVSHESWGDGVSKQSDQ
jgi:hypothetical protein